MEALKKGVKYSQSGNTDFSKRLSFHTQNNLYCAAFPSIILTNFPPLVSGTQHMSPDLPSNNPAIYADLPQSTRAFTLQTQKFRSLFSR